MNLSVPYVIIAAISAKWTYSERRRWCVHAMCVCRSVCLCVYIATPAWRHNNNDVITSPIDCLVCDVTSSNAGSYSK